MGRPPQEDTTFGALIHELTGPIIPSVLPGVHAVHAVDAAGVHPLLLAIASERYVPDAPVRRPQEILTTANAMLGQGQLSLAKYLLIVAREDDPALDIHDIPALLSPPPRARRLDDRPALPDPDDDRHARLLGAWIEPGVEGRDRGGRPDRGERSRPSCPATFACRRRSEILGSCCPASWPSRDRLTGQRSDEVASFCAVFESGDPIRGFPLIVIVDDSEFTARTRTELPVGHLHPLRIRPPTSRESGRSSTRSTGVAPAPWSSTPGSSRTMLLRWSMIPRSSAESMLWPRRAVRCTGSIDSTLAPTERRIGSRFWRPLSGERSDMAPEKLESDANVSPLRTSDLIDAARQDSAHAKILVQQLVEAGEWPAPDLLDQIVIAGDAAVGPLLEMLRAIPKTRPDPHVVRNVMGLLTALSPQEVITELVHLVQHADVEHSGDAADALGRCGDAGFNALVELCESDSLKGYRLRRRFSRRCVCGT